MNPSSTKKTLTVLVVLLFFANMATLGLFWYQKIDKKAEPKGRAADFIIKELGFNENQKATYLKLVEEHQMAVRPVREDLKIAKESLFSLLREPNTSQADQLKAAQASSVLTEKLDLITFQHFAKVRGLCNEKQQERFDEIIDQVMQMMAQPHPPRGAHPPGPPPMGPDHEMPDRDRMPPPPHD